MELTHLPTLGNTATRMQKTREAVDQLAEGGHTNFAEHLAAASTPEAFAPIRGIPELPSLANVHYLSKMTTTLPDGRELAVFRFDLNSSLSQGAPHMPTLEEKKSDESMFQGLKQLAAYFDHEINARNTRLEGTAAIDIQL